MKWCLLIFNTKSKVKNVSLRNKKVSNTEKHTRQFFCTAENYWVLMNEDPEIHLKTTTLLTDAALLDSILNFGSVLQLTTDSFAT